MTQPFPHAPKPRQPPRARPEDVEIRRWLGDAHEPSDRWLWLLREVDFDAVATAAGWTVNGLTKALRRRGWRWGREPGTKPTRCTHAPCRSCRKRVALTDLPNRWVRECRACRGGGG